MSFVLRITFLIYLYILSQNSYKLLLSFQMAQLPEGITELLHHEKLSVPLVGFNRKKIVFSINTDLISDSISVDKVPQCDCSCCYKHRGAREGVGMSDRAN